MILSFIVRVWVPKEKLPAKKVISFEKQLFLEGSSTLKENSKAFSRYRWSFS